MAGVPAREPIVIWIPPPGSDRVAGYAPDWLRHAGGSHAHWNKGSSEEFVGKLGPR